MHNNKNIRIYVSQPCGKDIHFMPPQGAGHCGDLLTAIGDFYQPRIHQHQTSHASPSQTLYDPRAYATTTHDKHASAGQAPHRFSAQQKLVLPKAFVT
jgi:hypothetical protein